MNFSNISPNLPIMIDKDSLYRYSEDNIISRAKELNADIILSEALDGKCMILEFRQINKNKNK